MNEEIPTDSLAATGTRFQRQIRTDRVRPSNSRSRASTVSSTGSHGRGHGRNLSTSSIGSTTSTISRDDSRRRPPPLLMSGDSKRRSLDPSRTPEPQYSYQHEPSEGPSTPTSTTFSNEPDSPGYRSSFGSPASGLSRSGAIYGRGNHGRRLSVPSATTPFQSPYMNQFTPAFMSPLTPSNASHISNQSSALGSPMNSTYSFARQDHAQAAEAEAWRRRTWHPSTYQSIHNRPATSGLSYYQTPDAPRPAFAPQATSAARDTNRLPGIEAFDQMSRTNAPPQNRVPSPMQVDAPGKPPIYAGPANEANTGPYDRRGHASWDMSLHHNLTRLDLANSTPPRDVNAWRQQTIPENHDAGPRPTSNPAPQAPIIHQEVPYRQVEAPAPPPQTSMRAKRQGLYLGHPVVPQQETPGPQKTPEDSSSSEGIKTPSFSTAEYHPSIVHSNGYVESPNAGTHPANNVRFHASKHSWHS